MRLIRQRAGADCGVAALAMIARKSYGTVKAAAGHRLTHDGLSNREVVETARVLGLTLVPTRKKAEVFLAHAAVVRLRWSGARGKKFPGGHFVAVHLGKVYDPASATILTVAEYLKRWEARVGTVLVNHE